MDISQKCPLCGHKQSKYKSKYCMDCNKEISRYNDSVRCHRCNSKTKRTIDWAKVYSHYLDNGSFVSKTAKHFKISTSKVRYIRERMRQ